METKISLRRRVSRLLEEQSPADRQHRNLAIQKKLKRLPAFKKACMVFFYVSRPEEVDTHPLIDEALAAGKRVAVPSSDLKTKKLSFFEIADREKHLKLGVFDVLEPRPELTKPVSAKDADFVVVPGVVFDRKNRRVGHGAGFYDRFLKEIGSRTAKVGLAFSFQVVDEVPQEIHDVALDKVLTD